MACSAIFSLTVLEFRSIMGNRKCQFIRHNLFGKYAAVALTVMRWQVSNPDDFIDDIFYFSATE